MKSITLLKPQLTLYLDKVTIVDFEQGNVNWEDE